MPSLMKPCSDALTLIVRDEMIVFPSKAINQSCTPMSGRPKNVTCCESRLAPPGQVMFILLEKCLLSFLEGGKRSAFGIGLNSQGKTSKGYC